MKIYFLASYLLVCISTLHAQGVITYSIKPYFQAYTDVDHDKLRTSLTIPGKLTKKILRNLYSCDSWTEGIFNSYYGYLAVSGCAGQVTFPRKHHKDEVYLLITERIQPIMMIGNTIHHWITEPTVPSKLYSLQRIATGDRSVWEIQEKSLPHNGRIPLDTLIIFANPKDMHVTLGKQEASSSSNLILPDVIFAKKGLNRTTPALWILKMRQFFGPIIKIYKPINPTYFSDMLMQS